jgi:hypothetical protein
MGKPIRIWKFLGVVDWWMLLLLSMVETFVQLHWHVSAWVPTISGLWFLAQAAWLKTAEPDSRAPYFYIAGFGARAILDLVHVHPRLHLVVVFVQLIGAIVFLVGIFVFRSELKDHFGTVEPRGLQLSGVMTFFFNELYFQYWFHQIYKEQTDPGLSIISSEPPDTIVT